MKGIVTLALAAAVSLPLAAGEIHGKVVCKGVRDSGDAVVYVESVPGKTFPPPKEHALINQENLRFGPHVLPVLAGTTVDFQNSDAVLHNVFSPDACAEKFNLGTWPKGEKRSRTFRKECFAALLCMVHPEMEAWIAVLPTPYYAVTAPDGSYRIPNVADGTYVLKVWHPRFKTTQKSVTVHDSTDADFELGR